MNAPVLITPVAEPVEALHPDGLYFGLPHETYRADPALGSTDMKRLAADPAVYWWGSVLNPNRQPEQLSAAKVFGSAVHKLVLEGEDAFRQAYAAASIGPGFIHTADDASAWIKATAERHGIKPKLGASKADRLANMALLAAEVGEKHPPIADRIDAANVEAGRIILAPEVFERMLAVRAAISRNPYLAAAFEGPTEVSVFWTRDEVRRKARFDCLKIRSTPDLKTISPKRDVSFRENCVRALSDLRYDIQGAHYDEGRRAAAAFRDAGAVFGADDIDPVWLSRFEGEAAFVLVFVRTDDGPPQTCPLTLSPAGDVIARCRLTLDIAAGAYREAMAAFGPHTPWITADAPDELDIAELPAWHGRS